MRLCRDDFIGVVKDQTRSSVVVESLVYLGILHFTLSNHYVPAVADIQFRFLADWYH